MDKYAAFVWSSYAIFGAWLAWDFLAVGWRHSRLLRSVKLRQRRARQRNKA